MANANKNKGKAYERVIAKHLGVVTGFNFERVPNSGAFVGGKNFFRVAKLSKEQTDMFEGDIIMPVEWDHVRIECKHYQSVSWGAFFTPKGESKLNGWIEQAEQGRRPNWFLIFRINHIGDFVVTKAADFFPVFGSGQYTLNANAGFMIYRGEYRIFQMDGFFERNKEAILSRRQVNGNNIGNEQN